jgi:hypothetical protein
VITELCVVLGMLAGSFGILLAVSARRYAARAAAECAELITGRAGSPVTADPRAIRDLAVVRYDALHEMSGQLSFSVALLNAAGDGVVLSSINGRTETRTYAKVVLAGAGTQELSPEEEQAVRSARLGAGLPDAPQAASPRPAPARTGLSRRPGLPGAAGETAGGGAAGGQRATPIGGSRPL